jgi:hypothetical protein
MIPRYSERGHFEARARLYLRTSSSIFTGGAIGLRTLRISSLLVSAGVLRFLRANLMLRLEADEAHLQTGHDATGRPA